MKTIKTLSLICLALLIFAGCKDVVEPDLSKQSITLLTPQDHDTTSDPTITFWWKKIDEQNTYRYRIQVAKPNFISPQALLLDSVTTSDKYTFTLSPGAYEWRIRSENGSSYTPYSTRALVVDSNLNLSNQMVTGLTPTPVSSATVYANSVNFSWTSLPAADYYSIELAGGSASADNTIYSNITSTGFSHTFAGYGTYTWRVTAHNASSVSKPSNLNTVIITLKPPYALAASADSSATPNAPITLTWNNYAPPATSDSLFIYKSSLNGTQVYAASITNKTFIASSALLPAGFTYWWKVRSTDGTYTSPAVSSSSGFKIK